MQQPTVIPELAFLIVQPPFERWNAIGTRGLSPQRRTRETGGEQRCQHHASGYARIVHSTAGILFLHAEAIENTVVRADVDAAVGYRKPAPVVPRSDLIAARP